MNNLPDDCLISIIKFLDLLTLDIVYLKTSSRYYNKLLRKKISIDINKYISLKGESFFQKSAMLHIFQRDLLRQIKESCSVYERDNLMMLLEGGWL